mmetsp:Transcript_8020/g.12391  ORF Transcript_8020/g.12391 Transcript_8020/m.12391 type:complete len:129 (-) Transcript_8020:672-1058(-)
MFSLASGIYQTYLTPTKLSLMVIGLEGTGKTTLLERFKVTNFTTSTNKSRNSGFTSKCFGPRPVDQDEDEIENLNSQPQEDYDLKPGAKMMPANRIQRTGELPRNKIQGTLSSLTETFDFLRLLYQSA